MEFKYYKVTEGKLIDRIKQIRASRTRIEAAIKRETGCSELLEWSSGGLAGLVFDKEPDMTVYKDAKTPSQKSYLPRKSGRGKKIHKRIEALGNLEHIQDAINVFNMPKMVIGERTARGDRVYSSNFGGCLVSLTMFVKVPQEKENPYQPECDSLVEVKEWEVMKFMDELKDGE